MQLQYWTSLVVNLVRIRQLTLKWTSTITLHENSRKHVLNLPGHSIWQPFTFANLGLMQFVRMQQ